MPSRAVSILGSQALFSTEAKLRVLFSVVSLHCPMAKSQASGWDPALGL